MADISKIRLENETYNIKDETARNDIASLQIPKSKLAGRKIILIGDSYAEGYTPDGNVTSWQTFFKNLTGLSNTITKYQGGAGFVNISDNKTFQTLLEEVTSDNEITDVVVLGGYNDTSYNYTQIKNAINSFAIKSREKFPNANIYIGMVGWSKNSASLFDLNKTLARYKTGSPACNVSYLNNIEYSLHDYFNCFASDGFHANEHGQYNIALNLIQALSNGSADVQYEYTNITFTPSSSVNSISDMDAVGCTLVNNIVEVSSQKHPIIYYTTNKPSVSSRNNRLEIATIGAGYIVGTNYPISQISVKLIIGCDAGFKNAMGMLIFQNGKIYLEFGQANDNGNGYQSYANITQIQMSAFHGILNSQFC